MPSIGPLELIVVLVIALVILGPRKLPQMGRSVGMGMREFKDAISGDDSADDRERRLAAPHPQSDQAEERREQAAGGRL